MILLALVLPISVVHSLTLRPDEHGERERLCGHGALAVLVHGRRVQVRPQLLVHAELVVLRPAKKGRDILFILEDRHHTRSTCD